LSAMSLNLQVLPPLGRRDPSPERTLLLRRRSYGLMRRSRWGSLLLRLLASFGESLQVVTSPCCPRQLPDVISNSLFLDAGSPTPAVHRVLTPVSSTVPSAFPNGKWVGFPQLSRLKRLRARGDFRGCRYFVMFRPPSLLAPQIVPTAANTPAGQPGLLRPSRTRFVASPRIGYANRPKTGNWRCGDLRPARLRPCRLLLCRVGEDVATLAPHRPERALLTHSVPRVRDSFCYSLVTDF